MGEPPRLRPIPVDHDLMRRIASLQSTGFQFRIGQGVNRLRLRQRAMWQADGTEDCGEPLKEGHGTPVLFLLSVDSWLVHSWSGGSVHGRVSDDA